MYQCTSSGWSTASPGWHCTVLTGGVGHISQQLQHQHMGEALVVWEMFHLFCDYLAFHHVNRPGLSGEEPSAESSFGWWLECGH